MEEVVEWVEILPRGAGDSRVATGYDYESEDEFQTIGEQKKFI